MFKARVQSPEELNKRSIGDRTASESKLLWIRDSACRHYVDTKMLSYVNPKMMSSVYIKRVLCRPKDGVLAICNPKEGVLCTCISKGHHSVLCRSKMVSYVLTKDGLLCMVFYVNPKMTFSVYQICMKIIVVSYVEL